jgi:hypothetical protein
LALTLAGRHEMAVCSQDKDFSVSGLDAVTTGVIARFTAESWPC